MDEREVRIADLAVRPRLSADQYELIAQFDARVVLDGQVIDLVLPVAVVAQIVTGPDRSMHARRLEARARRPRRSGNLYEEEQFVEDVALRSLQPDVALELCFDVLEHRLDGVAVRVTCTANKTTSSKRIQQAFVCLLMRMRRRSTRLLACFFNV